MIARLWRGVTRAQDHDAYLDYLHKTGVADILKITGNRGVRLFHRIHDGQAEFVFLSLWESFDAIRAFAGPQPDRAVYYPADRKFLLELTPEVAHYTMEVFEPQAGTSAV